MTVILISHAIVQTHLDVTKFESKSATLTRILHAVVRTPVSVTNVKSKSVAVYRDLVWSSVA